MATLKEMLDGMTEEDLNKKCDGLVIISVANNPDGTWRPWVMTKGLSPKDCVMACAFTAKDIADQSGISMGGEDVH